MKIGMLFPGYGSQFVGMAKELYDSSRIMQEHFEQAAQCLDKNFVKLCFASSDAELRRADHALVAIFLVSAAIAEIVKKELGITPDLMAGRGVGEMAALCAAGGVTFADGLYLLNKYATSYQEMIDTGAYTALRVAGMNSTDLQALCEQHADETGARPYIAAYEGPEEHVIIGQVALVEQMRESLKKKIGARKTKEIPLVGLHAPVMEPVLQQLTMYLQKVDVAEAEIPVVNNVNAALITHKDDLKFSLLRQLIEPLRWHQVLKAFADCDLLICVGPGTALAERVAQRFPEKQVVAINTPEDLETLKKLVPNKPTEDVDGNDV